MARAKSKTPYRDTEVKVSNSQEAIRKLLSKHDVKATRFTFAGDLAAVEFVRHDQPYRITARGLGMDDKSDRQIWRVLYFWLKSKMEAIDFNLMKFETEFLPYAVISNGRKSATVAEAVRPRLEAGTLDPDDPFRRLLGMGQ